MNNCHFRFPQYQTERWVVHLLLQPKRHNEKTQGEPPGYISPSTLSGVGDEISKTPLRGRQLGKCRTHQQKAERATNNSALWWK